MMQVTFSKSMTWLVGTALLVSTVGAGTVWSFVRTAQHAVRESVRDAVPLTFELQRLEQLTRDLIPEIQSNQKVAAQLDVEVEYLQREVEAIGKSQVDARSQMEKLRAALDSPNGKQDFGGRTFSKAEIELDLNRRLERFENDAVQKQAKEKLLEARRRTLAAATEKIQQYQRQHALLVEKAESLQGELKLVELASNAQDIAFDGSKLKQAKELSQQVEKRIRTVQKLVDGQIVPNEIPVDADARPVTERFDTYFGRKVDAKPVAANCK
jgi:hypothetical protein